MDKTKQTPSENESLTLPAFAHTPRLIGSQWHGRAQQMEVQFAGLDPPQYNRIIYRVRANWLGWPHPGAGQGCPSQPQPHPGLELLMQPHIPGSCEYFWVPDGCHLTVWGRMLKSGRETFWIFNFCLRWKLQDSKIASHSDLNDSH